MTIRVSPSAENVPGVSGQSGKYLTTDGQSLSWGSISAGGMTLISTTNLSGATTTLSSIPQTYTDLQVIVQGMKINSGTGVFQITFNNNTNSEYPNQVQFNQTDIQPSTPIMSGNSTTWLETSGSDAKTMFFLKINLYTSTTYGKPFFHYANFGVSGSDNRSQIGGGMYINTSAITSIEIKTNSSTFSGGRVLLYGVK